MKHALQASLLQQLTLPSQTPFWIAFSGNQRENFMKLQHFSGYFKNSAVYIVSFFAATFLWVRTILNFWRNYWSNSWHIGRKTSQRLFNVLCSHFHEYWMWLPLDAILWGGGGTACNELASPLGWELSSKRNGSYELYAETKTLREPWPFVWKIKLRRLLVTCVNDRISLSTQ